MLHNTLNADTQTIMESKQTFHSRPEHGNGELGPLN